MDISTIQKRIALMEKYKKEIKDAKEMLQGELENDPAYVQAVEEAKVAVEKKKRTKDEVLSRGSNSKLVEEIKNSSEEVSLLKEILSAELMQVFKEEGTDEIADADGESRKFKVMVTLLPKGAKVQNRDNFGKYTAENDPNLGMDSNSKATLNKSVNEEQPINS